MLGNIKKVHDKQRRTYATRTKHAAKVDEPMAISIAAEKGMYMDWAASYASSVQPEPSYISVPATPNPSIAQATIYMPASTPCTGISLPITQFLLQQGIPVGIMGSANIMSCSNTKHSNRPTFCSRASTMMHCRCLFLPACLFAMPHSKAFAHQYMAIQKQ